MNYKIPALALLGLSALLLAAPGHAAECATTVEANDAMQFSVKDIAVPKSCETFAVTLKHTGKLPATAMGHNIVITTEANAKPVDQDGMKAGADNDYVKPGDDRVIAHSSVVGGGESTTFDIPVSALSADDSYRFFCSFPGHFAIMQGSVTLVD